MSAALWVKLIQGLVTDFLMGETGTCPLGGVAESCLSGGCGFVSSCDYRKLCAWVDNLLMGGAVFPSSLLFGLELLSPDG